MFLFSNVPSELDRYDNSLCTINVVYYLQPRNFPVATIIVKALFSFYCEISQPCLCTKVNCYCVVLSALSILMVIKSHKQQKTIKWFYFTNASLRYFTNGRHKPTH